MRESRQSLLRQADEVDRQREERYEQMCEEGESYGDDMWLTYQRKRAEALRFAAANAPDESETCNG